MLLCALVRVLVRDLVHTCVLVHVCGFVHLLVRAVVYTLRFCVLVLPLVHALALMGLGMRVLHACVH